MIKVLKRINRAERIKEESMVEFVDVINAIAIAVEWVAERNRANPKEEGPVLIRS